MKSLKLSEFTKIEIVETERGKKYIVKEPKLTKEEKSKLSKLKKLLMKKVEYDYETTIKEGKPEKYLIKKLKEVLPEVKGVGKKSFKKFKYYILRDFTGLGKVDPIIKDPNIEDVYCNGVGIPVFVRHKKHGSMRTNIVFEDAEELEKFVMVLAQKCKRFVTYAEPLLDATLPDGSRVQATFGKDVTLKGPTFSIRKFQKLPMTPIELIRHNTVSPALMAYFWLAIENNTSMLIAGGSGTGKTTFLNAICMFIPPDFKIISIEDTSELNLPHKNWVKAITRSGYGPPTGKGRRYGEVTMFDLLKTSLRQRPDYVLVGEVRGPEASVLFQGMASGHPSLGTIHAESLEAVIERLTTPPINLPSNLVELIDVVVIEILATSKGPNARRLSKVIEVKDVSHGKADIKTPFLWDPYSDKFMPIETFLTKKQVWQRESLLVEKISLKTGKSKEELLKELRRRERILKWMDENDITNYFDFFNIISDYWYSPESVMKRVKAGKKPKGKKGKGKEEKRIPVRKVKGIGKKSVEKLKKVKATTAKSFVRLKPETLAKKLGISKKTAKKYQKRARKKLKKKGKKR